MTLVLGIALGYYWCFYHKELDCSKIKQSEYEELLQKWIPPDYIVVKHRNPKLMLKLRELESAIYEN